MAVLVDLLNPSVIEYLVQAPFKSLGLSILLYTLLVICYRIWFHPLAKYPGPFVAKISNLWNLYHTVKADRPYVTQDLHEKYGDFVRLGPNFLSVNSHYALKDIYGIGKNTQKGAWYSNLQPGLRSVFNVVDKKIHSSKRNALAPAFTEKVFKKNEPYILKHIDRLVEIIGEECDKGQRGVCAMNIGKWANYLTYDIMGELTFSRDYGSLNGVDPDMPDCIDAQQFATMIVGVEPKIRLFRLQSLFFPALGKRATELQARVLQMLDQRLKAGDDGRQDYLWWLENSKDEDGNPVYSKEELFSESIILVAAGTESTAGQIAALMFYLSIYPEIQAELHRQLRQTYKAYEDIVIGPELDQLEYLQACYKESLRMSPGGAGILPRETCQGGVTINRGEGDSEHLPAGIEIGTPTYTLHHDARYHPDPYAFNPERWIPSSVGSEAVERAQLAYAPFSIGSRQCIGRRLARLEITLSIAKLVWRFDTSYVGSALDEERLRTKGWKEYKIIDHFSFQRIGPVVHFRRRDGV